ncbi:heme-binding protein 2-like [Acanthaster planci]|uniref:Heme-binding protein 2-like n=1 Tax=Acanthaster planci TaxID=133434 RepID=A0A8B8A0G0_ACAPL|nr:heme-binding protein 2-like [Acanthaster planci]
MAISQGSLVLLLALTGFIVCTGFSINKHDKGESGPPFFCHELECPKFKEDYNSSDYQIRRYETSKWVSTTITGIDYQAASEEAFLRLYEYIQGQNDQKVKIPMTVPVINSVQPGLGPVCASNFTFSFFVPFEFQSNTPKPTNPELFLTTLDQHKAYVRVYSGFTNEKVFPKEAAALAAALNSTQTYDKSYYYLAGYDSPFVVHNRHNEIWFIATEK